MENCTELLDLILQASYSNYSNMLNQQIEELYFRVSFSHCTSKWAVGQIWCWVCRCDAYSWIVDWNRWAGLKLMLPVVNQLDWGGQWQVFKGGLGYWYLLPREWICKASKVYRPTTNLKYFFVKVGHADFYPNKGHHPQPGCENEGLALDCSHQRAPVRPLDTQNDIAFQIETFFLKPTGSFCWKCSGSRFLLIPSLQFLGRISSNSYLLYFKIW